MNGLTRLTALLAAIAAAVAFALVLSTSDAAATGLPQIDSGAYHTCAVAVDATLVCWGDNAYGQRNPPSGTFTSVSSGFYHSCAVRTNGSVACWGWNGYGQSSPPAGGFKSVTAGYAHTCAVRADDAAVCWGGYGYGTAAPGGSFSDVASGNDFSCGVRTTGALTCWGYNHPDGNAAIPPPGTFSSVEIGMWHSCAVRSDSSAACWGQGGHGESSPPPGSFNSVTTGGAHSCGIRTDASLACWGASLGLQPSGSFDSVSSGYAHACAVRTDGTIVCWGNNGSGQTDAPVIDSTPPSIASSIIGTPGNSGWYTSDVSLTWSVSEPDSPTSLSTNGCNNATVTSDQPPATYSCSASSLGGSSGPVVVTIGRDATPPAVNGAATTTPNLNGWYSGDMTIHWTCADATSGLAAACPADAVISGEGENLSASVLVADAAGNQTSATSTPVKIDRTAPTVTYPGNAGAYTVDQTLAIACHAQDGLSGLASSACAGAAGPAYSFSLGANVLSGSAIDKAGNVGVGSTTFTVAVTPVSLCALTRQFVQGSETYQALALTPAQQAKVDGLATALCQKLDALIPTLTSAKKASFVAAYKVGVSALVPLGWLTPAQATTLKSLASAL